MESLDLLGPPQKWIANEKANECAICWKQFNIAIRKHHCRQCGKVICSDCSKSRRYVIGFRNPERVCDNCVKMFEDLVATALKPQHYERKHSSQSMHFDPVTPNSNRNSVVRPIQSDSDLKSSVFGFERYSDGSLNYNNCDNSTTSSDNSVIAASSPMINNLCNNDYNIENNNICSENSNNNNNNNNNNNEMNENNKKNIIHQRNQSLPISISEILKENSLPRVKSQEQQKQQNKEGNENENTMNKFTRGRFYSNPNINHFNSSTPKLSSKTPNNKSPSNFPITIINSDEVSHSMSTLLETSSSDNRNENGETINNNSSEDLSPRNEEHLSTCSLSELGSNLLRKIEETKDQEPGEYLESLDKIQDDIAESSSHSQPISPLNTSCSNIIQQKQPKLEAIPPINSDNNNFTLSCLEESVASLSKEVSEMRERLNILNENVKCNQIPNQFNTILTITNFVILFLFTIISYFFK